MNGVSNGLQTFLNMLSPMLPAEFAPAVRAVDWRKATPGRPSAELPVLRFWPTVCAAGGKLMTALAGLSAQLRWVQNPNYVGASPDPNFLQNYGYAVLAGPGGLVETESLALGILLLGPATHYPTHRHPAVEIYVIAAGRAEWRRGEEAWRTEAPGSVIRHESMMPHATRTLAEPLLAVYVWQGDLKTHARIVSA